MMPTLIEPIAFHNGIAWTSMIEPIEVSEIEKHVRTLLHKSLDGDAKAYQLFLKELAGLLRIYFRRRLASLPDEVEDLVQESLLAIHNKRHTYDRSQPATAWIYAIAKYKLIDMLRRHERYDKQNDPLDEDTPLFTPSADESADARRDVHNMLALLPDQMRLPIILTKLEGLSVAETAKRTGLTESAVKVGVHRGLKKLHILFRGKP
ncbi:sigma-70 family RNA polymerase sigma factor [Halothiobacillus sp. 15-55-196]|jgi:RNA polymerase sigma-70 factor (ECF subfamily)|uniref:sigma-70 family RNA polymerase sigma factor n=1 Tax=Halothiobacillus sp. 15-55-196 TaxID=1970382 RepID=UPI0025B90187|nr:sigma-70 family RNA polymerase sigma factor [Halothiobacillus sp. 15-55-196]